MNTKHDQVKTHQGRKKYFDFKCSLCEEKLSYISDLEEHISENLEDIKGWTLTISKVGMPFMSAPCALLSLARLQSFSIVYLSD